MKITTSAVAALFFLGGLATSFAAPDPCEDFLGRHYGKMRYGNYVVLDRATRLCAGNAEAGARDAASLAMAARRWNPALARDAARAAMRRPCECGAAPGNLPWALWQLHKTAPDRAFLKESYDALSKKAEWWLSNRLDADSGLFKCSPDGKVFSVGGNCRLVLLFRTLRDFADELRDAAGSDRWVERGTSLENAIESRLWDAASECYRDRDASSGAFTGDVSPASFMPLLVGTATWPRADAMARHARGFATGWPSGRGPTRVDASYMALKGLAYYGHQETAERGISEVLRWIRERPVDIFEAYNPSTGAANGEPRSLSACAFAISFLLDWEMPRYMEMPSPFVEREENPAWVVRSYWMDGWSLSVSADRTKKYSWKCPGDGRYDATGEIMAEDDSLFTGRILVNGREVASGKTVGKKSLGIVAAVNMQLRKGDSVEIELAGTEKAQKKMKLDAFAVRRRDTVRTKYLSAPDSYHALGRRKHQGIPSVAAARNGRLWATWYANVNGCETSDNFAVLSTSADGGATWKEVLIADPDLTGLHRAFDPEVWATPDGRILWTWSDRVAGIYAFGLQRWSGCGADPSSDKVLGVYLDAENEPDAANLPDPFEIAPGVMMCKPIARRDGSWLLPVAHWFADPSSCFYESRDSGKTFTFVGGVTVPEAARTFDEHNVVEFDDGTLRAWIRTAGHHSIPGMMESVSRDGGKTWTLASAGKVPHCSSRVFVTKLANGHLVMVKNGRRDVFTDRRRLTAMVSRDGGDTWEGDLVLDERTDVSYPDGCQLPDGSILVIWDRERTKSLDILFARFSEDDVLNGGQAVKSIVSKP